MFRDKLGYIVGAVEWTIGGAVVGNMGGIYVESWTRTGRGREATLEGGLPRSRADR